MKLSKSKTFELWKKKEIKIVPPEGYEIDRENSTYDMIKFKPIKEVLTYNTIMDKLLEGENTMAYIANDGCIYRGPTRGRFRKNIAISNRQLQKILAINQLFNIAKYYNGGWEPNCGFPETKYFIYLKGDENELRVGNTEYNSDVNAYFRYEEDAQAVIDNPNFRAILDIIFK